MQGVEVLTMTQVVTEYAPNWPAFWITFAIIFGAFLVYGVIEYIKYCDVMDIVSLSIYGVILGGMLGVLIGCVLLIHPTAHETRYSVTISDEVLLTEFFEHYEMIEQDGKIFTVREKTNE